MAAAQQADIAFGAETQDTDQPVEVTADALSVDQESGHAVFSGNVLAAQGEMKLSADRVLVVYSADQARIARLEASGGVTLVSGSDAAEAQSADYDIDAGEIVMRGDVVLLQGDNVLNAQNMTVDLNTGTARMDGRVRTIMAPGD
ncbi:lipopolysaccharide transport periplasmic protein LptA [Sediminimonas sp.]|uniref:lipopolysaccharide transport periplasmic protein LptA n=1 Tax=Sediminimonas sp. TaxID=2823379 RepID=UPI0025E88C00|nr:lipopolysaccharide transport periplasmic protein LptA [Sediminimonas sp.]